MADDSNLVLSILRELRVEMKTRFDTNDTRFAELASQNEALAKKIESLRQAMIGESVLGRYTVAEVEERLETIEKRLSKIEAGH